MAPVGYISIGAIQVFSVNLIFMQIELKKFTEEEIDNEYKKWAGDFDKKPPTELRLLDLQKKYLMTRDHKYWVEILREYYPYLKSLILKRNNGGKWVDGDEMSSKAAFGALKFMKQYLTRPDFIVGTSFAGMSNWIAFEALKATDGISMTDLSLNEIVADSESGKELQDMQDVLGIKPITGYEQPDDFLDKTTVQDYVDDILSSIDEGGFSSQIKFTVYLYILLNLRGPKNRHCIPMFLNAYAQDYKTRQICESALLELYKKFQGITFKGKVEDGK